MENTMLEFRITDGSNWNKFIYSASCYPFIHFKGNFKITDEHVIKRQQYLLCFMDKLEEKKFFANFTVGLKKDQEIKTEKIVLYKYGNVYFPNNDYYNSDPLPIEWLEIFEESKNLAEIFEDKELEEYEEKYRIQHQIPKPIKYNTGSSRRNSRFLSPALEFDSGKNIKANISQESLVSPSFFTDEVVRFEPNDKAMLYDENHKTNCMDINEITKLKNELAEYYNIRDQIIKDDQEVIRTKGRSKSQPDIKSVSQRPPLPQVSITSLLRNIDPIQPKTTKNNDFQRQDNRKRAETARAAHRSQISKEFIIRPLSSIRMQRMESEDNKSIGMSDIMNKFSSALIDEQPIYTERVKRLRVKKHKKKKKPVGKLTQRDIYSAKSSILLPPVSMKSAKHIKAEKKMRIRHNAKPTTNDAESTNYTKEKSYLTKIQKNKSLLTMFGLEKPEQEKMKKLGVSTLADKHRKRIFSAKK